MQRKRPQLPPEVTAYIAHLIGEWERTQTMTSLAAKVKLSRTQLINVRDGDRGAGPELETAFAFIYHRGSVDELRRAALTYATEHPERVKRGRSSLESDATVRPVLGALPGFAASLEEARARRPGYPDSTWESVERTSCAMPPEMINGDVLTKLADMYVDAYQKLQAKQKAEKAPAKKRK